MPKEGDILDAIEACEDLEARLGRLKRRSILNDEEYADTTAHVEEVREAVEEHLEDAR